jgi:RNA polymerase sigma factor (sigma-70 family)
MEDAVSMAAFKVWRSLRKFDDRRSSFARFVTIVTLSEIRNLLDSTRSRHTVLDEAENLPSRGLNPEQRTLFNDWLEQLNDVDRAIARMLMDVLTQQEMAEALGISQSAVAQRLARLRRDEKAPF